MYQNTMDDLTYHLKGWKNIKVYPYHEDTKNGRVTILDYYSENTYLAEKRIEGEKITIKLF